MNNQRRNHILLWVVAIILGIANSSCSAKKKTHQSDVQEVKIENSEKSENSENSETNVKVDIKTKVDDKTKTVSTSKTWTPIDPSKPSSKTEPDGRKTEFNNSSYEEKTTTELKDQKTDNSDNSEVFRKSVLAGKTESKGKAAAKKAVVKDALDRSGFNLWSWLWVIGIIIIVIVLVYLNNRFNVVKRVTTFFSK